MLHVMAMKEMVTDALGVLSGSKHETQWAGKKIEVDIDWSG